MRSTISASWAASASASVRCAAGSVVESVTVVAAVDERERDGGREGRLADAAFAHRHDHAVAGGVELVDELVEAGAGRPSARRRARSRRRCRRPGELAQGAESGDVAGDEPDAGSGNRCQLRGRAGERGRLALGERERGRVVVGVAAAGR